MKRSLFILFCLIILITTACSSNKEVSFKIHPDYSDKFSSSFAIDLITFAALANEYNSIAFKSGEFSEKEEHVTENLNAAITIISNKLETLSPDELVVYEDISNYSLNIHVTTILKANHQIALINNEIGITEKDKYLDIQDDLKSMKKQTYEAFEEIRKYVTIK